MPRLYGRGAVVLSDDRNQYRPVNGVLDVPVHMVNRAKAVGFTEHPFPGMDADDVIELPVSAPPSVPRATLAIVDGGVSLAIENAIGAQSVRMGFGSTQLPPDAAIAQEGYVLPIDSEGRASATFDATVLPGLSLYATIIPFSGPGGAGTQLSAIHASVTALASSDASVPDLDELSRLVNGE